MIPNYVIQVEPFQPTDQAAVKELVLAGLVDPWGVLDPSLNPDLNDIAASYARAVFLVARHQGGGVIGSVALVPRAAGTAEIVRMSVARNARRQGIGRMITTQLVAHARAAGLRRIFLETTETWDEVIAFYLWCGFHITHHAHGDVYFALDL